MIINLEYKEDSNLDFPKDNHFTDEQNKQWFIKNMRYYQALLCKINIYIEFYKQLFDNVNKLKNPLKAILLESFCESIAYIIYKLFGEINKSNILKFRNDIRNLYNENAVDFKSDYKLSNKEKIIEAVLEARKKVYGHSDDESFCFEDIESLMSKINIDDIMVISEKCMAYLNDLWKNFCGHELSFELKDHDVIIDTFSKIIEQM